MKTFDLDNLKFGFTFLIIHNLLAALVRVLAVSLYSGK